MIIVFFAILERFGPIPESNFLIHWFLAVGALIKTLLFGAQGTLDAPVSSGLHQGNLQYSLSAD